MKPHLFALIGTASVYFSVAVPAQTPGYERAPIVHARRVLMYELDDRYWILQDASKSSSGDLKDAEVAAREMIEIISEFVTLLVPQTARGEAPGSRAKPEVWTDAADFATSVENFRAEAGQLAEVASTGDAVKFSEALERFSFACTACHEFRPSSGGRFRFPLEH